MENKNSTFEQIWCIIELFGHQKMAGLVSEQQVAGANMVRVDVPETSLQANFTRFLNPSAIYAINPTTEELARGMAEKIQTKPIASWDAREMIKRIDQEDLRKRIETNSLDKRGNDDHSFTDNDDHSFTGFDVNDEGPF